MCSRQHSKDFPADSVGILWHRLDLQDHREGEIHLLPVTGPTLEQLDKALKELWPAKSLHGTKMLAGPHGEELTQKLDFCKEMWSCRRAKLE